VDFAFSEEQQMLRDSAREWLADKLPLDRVPALADSDDGWDPATWPAIAALGWTGLSVPEEHGGAGMGFLDEAVIFEEFGYGLYAGPYFATVGLALPAIAADPDLTAAVVAGESAVTLAYAEPSGPFLLTDLEGVGTKAQASNGSWTLTGEKHLVVDLGPVDTVVVAARSSDGLGLWAVRKDDASATDVQSTMDSTRRLGRLGLSGTPARLLVEPNSAAEIIERIRLRALVAVAVEAVGVAQRALDLATEHAKERNQFDKPIGTYQAVSHQIADTYVETELARSVAYWAAWCVAEGDAQAPVAAAAAKSVAAEAAVAACERSIQVHGGIGFTWEHVLHRLYKRAQWIESFEGGGAGHRADVAAHLLD